MTYLQTLILEAVFVGASLAIVLAVALRMVRPTSITHTLILGFIIGVGLHLGYEALGLNKYYCSTGASCRR